MQRIVSVIPRDCNILFVGDTHEGTVFFHDKGLRKIVNHVEKDRAHRRVFHMGDWIEAIPSDDRRYDNSAALYNNPGEQAEAIVKRFKSIKNQMLGGLHGNHERALYRIKNFADQICKDLNIPYGTGMCRLIFNDDKGRHLFNVFACHGYWLFKSQAKDPEQEMANKKASMKMRLKKLMGDAAVMLCGHAHELIVAEPVEQLYLTDEPYGVKQHYLGLPNNLSGYIPVDQRFYGCTGSLRKNQMDGFTDYAEGFPPAELGCLDLAVRDGRPATLIPMKV